MRVTDVLGRYRRSAIVRLHDVAGGMSRECTPQQLLRFEQALDDADRYDRLALMAPGFGAVMPDDVYADGEHSFWRDLVAQRDDPSARWRLANRNKAAEDHFGAEHRSGDLGGGFLMPGLELRAGTTTTMAGLVGDGFQPDAAGGLPTTGRPVLDAIVAGGFPTELPATGNSMTIQMARTQGVTAASQSAENASFASTDPVYIDVEVPIVTVVARVDMSYAAFDRRVAVGDAHITKTVRDALAAEQERQLFSGSGSSGEMTGILNAGVSMVTCSTASATIVTQKALEGARVGSAYRRKPARIVAMTPQRGYWLSAQTAGSNQPMPLEIIERAKLETLFSDGIPSTLSSNRDRIVICAPGDIVYAEDAPRVYVARNQLANTNAVSLIAYRYASMAVRYPSAVAAVTGPGLVAPSIL
jgi:hypothetical protein